MHLALRSLFVACGLSIPLTSVWADEWVSVFDGKTLAGWKANEKPESFSVENGEAQINTSFAKDPCKTGSLVDVKDLDTSPVEDNQWFEFHLVVQGKRIIVNINGKPCVDYTEEDKPVRKKGREERLLSHGPIALQAHDPESTTFFRNLQIKKLSD